MENLIMWRHRSLIAVFCLVMVVMPNLAFAQATTATPAAGASASATAGTAAPAADPTLSPRDCNVSFLNAGALLNPICIGRLLGAFLSSLFIKMGTMALELSGLLFNKLVGLTILKFGDKTGIYGLAQDGIESTWTAFRDIANILIIGFFIFIAICTILGIKEYGYKKLIARVLIISVLLNFSLLFTKMIIDGSNFTAVQFYQGVVAVSKTPNDATAGAGATEANISGTFLQFMGITGFSDAYAQLRETQEKSDSGLVGIMFGILSFILLIAAAIVLAYGSFLLVTRTILLLFLLITSAIAFATYLLPAFADSKFGWGQWWSSLIRCAVFAPLLMILLWATALVSVQISAGGPAGSGTIGKFIAGGATAAAGVQAIFTYLIVLGMLYASFKIADSFSTTIGGFNFAAVVPALTAGYAGRFAGAVGRQTIGRVSSSLGDTLQKKSQETGRSKFMSKLYDFGGVKAKGVGKRDFNPMQGKAGGILAGASGLKQATLAGPKVGGFIGGQEATAHKIAEQARRMTPDNDAKKDIVKAEIEKQLKDDPTLGEKHRDASNAERKSDSDHEEAKSALGEIHKQNIQEMKELHSALEGARSSLSKGAGSAADVQRAEQEVVTANQRHANAITAQTAIINNAKEQAVGKQRIRVDIENQALRRSKEMGNLPGGVRLNSEGDIASVDGFTSAAHKAGDLARNRWTSVLFSDKANEKLAHMAEHEVDHQTKKKKLKDSGLLDAFRDEAGGGGGNHTNPATQRAAGATQAPAAGGPAPH